MAKKKAPAVLHSQTILHGDCVVRLQIPGNVGRFHLALADPPFNFGHGYDAYVDSKPRRDYVAWTMKWLEAVIDSLHPHGSMIVFTPEEWVTEIDAACRAEFGLHKRREIVWAFTFGQAAQKNFTRSHCYMLYFTKAKTKFTFNADAARVPSARQLVYNDNRANSAGKLPDDVWMLLKEQLEPYLTANTTTWLHSRVCGTYKERQAHVPNQIPLPIYERLVKILTNPGDCVLDPFAGSSGSGVTCKQLARNWLGFDVSKSLVKSGTKRLAEAPAG